MASHASIRLLREQTNGRHVLARARKRRPRNQSGHVLPPLLPIVRDESSAVATVVAVVLNCAVRPPSSSVVRSTTTNGQWMWRPAERAQWEAVLINFLSLRLLALPATGMMMMAHCAAAAAVFGWLRDWTRHAGNKANNIGEFPKIINIMAARKWARINHQTNK